MIPPVHQLGGGQVRVIGYEHGERLGTAQLKDALAGGPSPSAEFGRGRDG
jgi:hypothetical protein